MHLYCILIFLLNLINFSTSFIALRTPENRGETLINGKKIVPEKNVLQMPTNAPIKEVIKNVEKPLNTLDTSDTMDHKDSSREETILKPSEEVQVPLNKTVTYKLPQKNSTEQIRVLDEHLINNNHIENNIHTEIAVEKKQHSVIRHPVGIESKENGYKPNKNIIESGALYRSFYVFFGLSIVGLAYFLFRSYRSGQAPSNIVQKYGVRTNRNDLEMTPLPISDDDEETLYESNAQMSRQASHYYDYNDITTYEIK